MKLREEIDRLCAKGLLVAVGLSDGSVLQGMFRAEAPLASHDDCVEFQASKISGPADGHLRGHCFVPLASISWIDQVR